MILHDDRSLLALQGPKAAEVLQVRVPCRRAGELMKSVVNRMEKVTPSGPCFPTAPVAECAGLLPVWWGISLVPKECHYKTQMP